MNATMLAVLNEEAAIELETRVRRARNKYVGQYRRSAATRVAGAASGLSPSSGGPVRIFTDASSSDTASSRVAASSCSRSQRCLVRSVPDSSLVIPRSYHAPGMRLALPGVIEYSCLIGLAPI